MEIPTHLMLKVSRDGKSMCSVRMPQVKELLSVPFRSVRLFGLVPAAGQGFVVLF